MTLVQLALISPERCNLMVKTMGVSRTASTERARQGVPAMRRFAVAAVVALLLGLGPAAFAGGAARAAQQATPAATTDPVVEFAFPDLLFPAGTLAADLASYRVDPGVEAEYPGYPADPSAAILWVQSGALALTGDVVAVQRGPGAAPDASPIAGETLLAAGDALALRLGEGHAFTIRNTGAEPLVFVEALVTAGALPIDLGIRRSYDFIDGTRQPRATTLDADATATLRLTRATLAPDEARAPAGDGWQVAAGDATRMTRSPIDGTVRNVSAEPLEVYILTAELTPVAATPVP